MAYAVSPSYWEALLGKATAISGKAVDSPMARFNQMMASGNVGAIAYLGAVQHSVQSGAASTLAVKKTMLINGINVAFSTYGFKFQSDPSKWGSSSSWTYEKWVQSGLNTVLQRAITVDGVFGSETKAAIKQFQTKYNLTVDGIWGPQCEAKMLQVYNVGPPELRYTSKAPTEPPYITPMPGEPGGTPPYITPMPGEPGGTPFLPGITSSPQPTESWLSRNWLVVGLGAVGVLLVGSIFAWYSQNKKSKVASSTSSEVLPS